MVLRHLSRLPCKPNGFTTVAAINRSRISNVTVCRSTAAAGTSFPGTAARAAPTPEEMQKRTEQLRELVQETVRIAVNTGPRGVFRAVQAGQAMFSLGVEYAQRGRLDPPEVVLRKIFERLGATYIKLGQFIASSPSLFPPEYVTEFQKCLDQTEPVSYDVIKNILQQELKRPLTDIFSSIDPVPLASASVAQVHAAVLKGSNKEVVIKVRKPGVEDVITTDMNFLYLLTRYLEALEPSLARLSLNAIFSDIRTSMMDEVDFMKEADHLIEFSTFLETSGLTSVATCPGIYRQFCSGRVLVMDRLRGVALTDLDAIRSITTRDPETVLISALNTWFASVLSCSRFHADVHAGNLLVLPDGRVGFIDFGIVGSISPATWRAVQLLVGSLATQDYDTMARALATIGACDTDVDLRAFARDLESFFAELEQVNTNVVVSRNDLEGSVSAAVEVDQTQVNRLLLELVRVGETHGIRFPREFGLFLKQLLYFDRYTRILAPSLQVLNDERINITGLDFPGYSPRSGGAGGSAGATYTTTATYTTDVTDVTLNRRLNGSSGFTSGGM